MNRPRLASIKPLCEKSDHLHLYALNYETDIGNKIYTMVSQDPDLKTPGSHPSSGSVIIAVNPDHTKLLLCREFRMAVNRFIYNLPSGFAEPGETPEQTAARELHEETGLTMTRLLHVLPSAFLAPAVTDMSVHTVICEADGVFAPEENPNEVIRPAWFSKDELRTMLQDGEFSARALDAVLIFLNLFQTEKEATP